MKRILAILLYCALVSVCAGENPFLPPALTGRTPWTDKEFKNRSGDFQFVIMSDRTGAMQRGVFADAARKVNLLQPEFVMSIGDLIDGYTEDESLVVAQWEEFDAIVDQLEMPFFHVPGNHDISNEGMLRHWQEKFGADYYYFLYSDVLFLCLSTELGGRIGEEQVEYFRGVIDAFPSVRWTLLFLHRPVWEGQDAEGFDRIVSHLATRPYTVFAGHTHAYRKTVRNGIRYITFATTGGGSPMRGVDMGEFHHVVWVTMTDEGPRIANLGLDGIHDEDIVDDETFRMVESLRDGSWFSVEPVVHDTAEFRLLRAQLQFQNKADRPMSVQGVLPAPDGLAFRPREIDVELEPLTTQTVPIDIVGGPDASIANLEPVRIELAASFDRDGKGPLTATSTREVLMDWRHAAVKLERDVTVDGMLDDWPDTYFEDCKQPQYVKEDWDWKGTQDGWFRFRAAWDDDRLFIAVRSFDDKLLFEDGTLAPNQDKFIVELDPRGESHDGADGDAGVLRIEAAPGVADHAETASGLPFEAACRADESGFTAEFAIPRAVLDVPQGGPWRTVRLNVAFMDHDNPQNTKPSVLWWRPPWNESRDYAGSGMFDRAD